MVTASLSVTVPATRHGDSDWQGRDSGSADSESAGEFEAASLSANALLGSPESSESRSSRAESESESD